MELVDAVIVFVASILIGGIGIHVGASLLADARDYEHAVITAGIGALVWVITNALVGGLPLVGPLLTLLAYLAVIKWRYRTGWLTAGGIALLAWIAALVLLTVLATVGITDFSAIGIPKV